jgi:hypothetical protein
VTFDDLDKGPKIQVHLALYEKELEVIDDMAARYNCSRAAVVGAWSREYREVDLEGRVPRPVKVGAKRSRRK